MDVDGITLAAMKALIAEVQRLRSEVEELKARQH